MRNLIRIFSLSAFFFLCYSGVYSQQVIYDWKHEMPGKKSLLLCMDADSSGNLYVGGQIDSICYFADTTVNHNGPVGFLAKFDPLGNLIWFKLFEYSEFVTGICFDSENNFYISGGYAGKVEINDSIYYTYNADTNYYGMFIAKFDTGGNTIWAKTTTGTFYYWTYGKLKQMCIDHDDNIVIIGTSLEELQYFDTTVTYYPTLDSAWTTYPYPHWVYYYEKTNYLVKFDKNGQKLWIRDLGMYNQHYYAITTDYSNNILMTGHFWEDFPFQLDTITLNGLAIDNIFIAKYDSLGKVLWAQEAGGSANGNYGYDIVADTCDNIYITGAFTGNNVIFGGNILLAFGAKHVFLTKYTPEGIVEWLRHYGTDDSGNCYDYGFTLSIKGDEILLSGMFRDSLNLGFIYLDYLPGPASGIFLRHNTNGDLLGAAIDNVIDFQVTPNCFFRGKDQFYYLSGNLWNATDGQLFVSRFPMDFLSATEEPEPASKGFLVAPNPCTDFIYIITDENPPFNVEIFDMTGKLIISQNARANMQRIDVSFLRTGFYIVRMKDKSQKIIKQ